MPFNWDYATLSHWSPTNCKSWFQIISRHFARSICCFWHFQSSDPPVHPLITGHHRDSTSLVWILSHWLVFQGDLGRGGIQSTSTGHWGSSGVSSLTPPLLHIHYITGSHHTSTWFLPPLLCWWHTAVSLISTWWSNGSCTDLRLPGGHLGMNERTSPTAQPGKDWASCLPCPSDSTAWFHHPARFFYNYPIKLSHKSWCNHWRQLTFKDHIAKTARSCRFALHNIIHVTPLFISLYWLPVAARIKFKTLIITYRTTTGSAPAYFHSLMTIYIPSRSLRSASERRLVVQSQRGSKSLSRTFSFTIPGWWNDLPTPIRTAGSLSTFKQQLKLSFDTTWLHPKFKKRNKKIYLPLFIPSLASLYLFEQCLRLGITSTSSVCLPL